MAGFQIPIETKIDFLENIVIPFFDVTLDSSQTRKDWMTETAENVYGDNLQTLIRSTNFIQSLEEAKAELREERAMAKLAFILEHAAQVYYQQQAQIQPSACLSTLPNNDDDLFEKNNLNHPQSFLQMMETIYLPLIKSEITQALSQRSRGTLSPVSPTNADHGKAILTALREKGAFLTVESVVEGDSVLPESMVISALELRQSNVHERELVNLYTPALQRVVKQIDSNLRLINSEEYQWLQRDRKCEMKPDLFVAYHALVEEKGSYDNAPLCDEERLFGKFPCWNCRSSVWCLLDANWKINDEAFGGGCKYLQSCGYKCQIWQDEIPTLKLVLFDTDEFWMIEGQETEITKVRTCRWSQTGSAKELKTFLTTIDPWMKCTELLLEMLGVQLHPSTPILGAGAYGRAFLLDDGKVLKVAVGPSAAKLEVEYSIILSIQKNPETAHFVIPVIQNSFRYCRSNEVCYAGYLLEYEGKKVESSCPRLARMVTSANLSPGNVEVALVEFLYDLHKWGLTHGDPRVDNVLLKDGQFKWIDFMDSFPCGVTRVEDFVLLFSSLTGVAQAEIRPRMREIVDTTFSGDSVEKATMMLSKMPTSDPQLDELKNYLHELWLG